MEGEKTGLDVDLDNLKNTKQRQVKMEERLQ